MKFMIEFLEFFFFFAKKKDNFEAPGAEFQNWEPADWTSSPKFLERIKDADYRQWATDLNDFWKQLGREMKEDVGVCIQHCGDLIVEIIFLTFILFSFPFFSKLVHEKSKTEKSRLVFNHSC